MVEINKKLLPIKAHYFFLMAAMGPILPQIIVFGKQLGISAEIMGYISSILPILYVLAKPAVGLLADYFVNFRKFIFISIILIMSLCYAGFYFVPKIPEHKIDLKTEWNLTGTFLKLNSNQCEDFILSKDSLCTDTRKIICQNSIDSIENSTNLLDGYIKPNKNQSTLEICIRNNLTNNEIDDNINYLCYVDTKNLPDCLYDTLTFWLFVILLCLGTIGFNVTNCISDAICFDVLGEKEEMKYGNQRVWGTIGFGLTALLSGIFVNMSTVDAVKSFTPALIIMLIFSGLDLLSVTKLKLPKLSSSSSLLNDVGNLLCQPKIVIFLCFATLAGIFDSFIIFYMFWHLEEVALTSGYINEIKLIEGCVVAAECLCGEIPMFLYSGKIIKKLGYVNCISVCFFTYSIRLGLISIITNPWYLIPIEMIMQGCTYALCYTCIVAYASAIAPAGTSATVQGLVAGMDDGLGFAIGSLIGGQMMKYFGGSKSFQMFAIAALLTCIAHIVLRPASKHETQEHFKNIDYVIPTEQITLNEKS